MLRILLVEDDANALDVVRQAILLHAADAEILVASKAEDAIELCKTNKPDLIIMDLSLPGINGWDALTTLRANPDTAGIRVAALTGYHSASVEQDALNAGFDGYFSKPIDVLSFGPQVAALAGG
jgi:CheY-like chemotaxis protein